MRRAELDAIFLRERARFARVAPRVAGSYLVVHTGRHLPSGGKEWRDMARTWLDTGKVEIVQRALRLRECDLVALIRHELGHLADPTPDAPDGEARADAIATRVGGRSIRYNEREIQTLCGGGPRPRHLHR